MDWQRSGNYEDIFYDTADGVAKITINRPEVRNAFRPKTLFELSDAFNARPGRPRDRRDHPHGRRRQGLLLGRRPADPRRRRLQGRQGHRRG